MVKARYHHGELRGALLDAAEVLVRERGVDGWSLREASARVGVSPSAAYHHFASRDALVSALSAQVIARLGELLRDAVGPAAGERRLVAYGAAYVRWALADPAVARLVFSAPHAGSDAVVSPHPHDVLAEELDRLAAAGGLPASARPGAEFVVWAAVHGLATLLLDGLVRIEGEHAVAREAERLVLAVLAGLAEEAPDETWPVVHSARTARRRT